MSKPESKTTLTAEELKAFERFHKEMEERTIPKIVEAVFQRQKRAAEYVRQNPWM